MANATSARLRALKPAGMPAGVRGYDYGGNGMFLARTGGCQHHENTFRKLQVCPCGAGIPCPLARLPLARSGGWGERTRKVTYAWAASRRVPHRLLHAPPPSAPVILPLRESNLKIGTIKYETINNQKTAGPALRHYACSQASRAIDALSRVGPQG